MKPHREILAHRLRAIVGKLINRGEDRVELIEDGGEQFVRFDGIVTGRSIQLYAGMDEFFRGFGLGDFAELVVGIQAGIGVPNLCKEEMIALVEFIPEDKRTTWLAIW